ncbi:MAG: nuclear transport factor 2 family protein [Pseudomonadota bacterium]
MRTLILVFMLVGFFTAVQANPQTDEEAIRQLHEKVLEAHRKTDIALLLEDAAADYVLANRGEISNPTLEDRRRVLGNYFGITTFTEYRDLVPPVVKVSEDGTLGWLICQVQAKGVQTVGEEERPFTFVSAWIELYEKQDGVWMQVGNVSNFKE